MYPNLYNVTPKNWNMLNVSIASVWGMPKWKAIKNFNTNEHSYNWGVPIVDAKPQVGPLNPIKKDNGNFNWETTFHFS